jgi:SNF2 family DNA or RNA helicase
MGRIMNESNLHIYQNKAVNHILANPMSGLMLDMGLGKTVSTLTATNKLLYEELEISNALVIAPKRVAENVWSTEVEKWDHLKHLRISKIIGNEPSRKRALHAKADIYIISRDNIAWLCGLYGGQMLPFDMLIIDESSSFKSPKSLRFKSLKRVQPSFQRVVILTGTPAPNGLIDLWPQIYLLDRGERLGKTLTVFRDRYFSPNQRNGHIVYNYKPKKESEGEIHNKISDICMSMKAKDYLDMPDLIDNKIELVLPEKVKKEYDKFEMQQVLELMEQQEEIIAINAAALSNKLLQFANGAVYDEDKDIHEMHKVKLEAVEEIIESANGKPVLIAWTFRHDLARLSAYLSKYKPVHLKSEQHIKDWNAGKIQVLLMHPASGGHGLNLQSGGNIIVWFGQTWSLELYQQLNARLYRQGQKSNQVIIHHLISKGTLDEDVIKSLKNKNNKQEGLLEAIKAKIDKYARYRK